MPSELLKLIRSSIEYSTQTKKVVILTSTKVGDAAALYQVRDENGVIYNNVPGTDGLKESGTLAFIDGDTQRPYLIGTLKTKEKAVPLRANIRLDWQDNSDNEDGFIIEQKRGKYGAWVQIATVTAGVTTFTRYNVLLYDDYQYRVKAFNQAGESGYTNVATVGRRNSSPN